MFKRILNQGELRRLLSELVPAMVISTIPALLIWLDTTVFGRDCRETGIVEIAQSGCLLIILILMVMLATGISHRRGGYALIAGFFATMLIREQNGILDHVVHGSWLGPALIVTCAALFFAWRNRQTILPTFLHVRNNHHFPALSLGLFLLLGFSRVFRHKSIWVTVCDSANFRAAKHIAEEGAELMAYAILLYWAVTYFIDLTKEARNENRCL